MMKFDWLLEKLPELKSKNLPGLVAHQKLIPPTRKLSDPKQFLELQPKIAGVLALLYPKNDVPTLVFTRRHAYKGVHSAQISFPGGKKEVSDATTWETAKREAFEEVCAPQNECELIVPLTPVYIPPSNFFVEPYLAIVHKQPQFIPQESEVKEILEIPLTSFFNTDALFQYEIPGYKGVFTPAYRVHENVIWGATAMMVSEITHFIGELKS